MFNAFSGIIKGRVQGVGFRYFAKNVAEELNLTGWVRNLPDGSVEVLAIGPETALEQFMQRLRIGPLASRVQSTQFHPLQEPEAFERFEIRG